VKRVLPLTEPTLGLRKFLSDEKNGNWEQFRNYVDYYDSNRNSAYKELMLALEYRQRGLCAYCEIDLKDIDRQIDHFHPKSDKPEGVDWTFIYTNLFAACKGGDYPFAPESKRFLKPAKKNLSCGAYRGNKVLNDDILNPAELPTTPSVFLVNDAGEIKVDMAACKTAVIHDDRAQATIDKLNLNCTRLKNARSEIWRKLEEDFQLLTEEGESDSEALSKLASDYLLPDEKGKLQEFFTTIRSYCGHYSESLLQDSAEAWL